MALRTGTALTTVQCLRTLFASFGVIVTYNGLQFSAAEFQEFCGSYTEYKAVYTCMYVYITES